MQPVLMSTVENLATRARKRRIELGLKQAEVARASGLKQSDVSKIENGKIQKTTAMIGLAKALQCNPRWLAYGQGGMIVEAASANPETELTPGAVDLARLYDMLPVHDRIRRAQAYAAATAAIVEVLELPSSVQQVLSRKKPVL